MIIQSINQCIKGIRRKRILTGVHIAIYYHCTVAKIFSEVFSLSTVMAKVIFDLCGVCVGRQELLHCMLAKLWHIVNCSFLCPFVCLSVLHLLLQ